MGPLKGQCTKELGGEVRCFFTEGEGNVSFTCSHAFVASATLHVRKLVVEDGALRGAGHAASTPCHLV